MTELRRLSNRWLLRVLNRQSWDTVLNLGCGDDDDGEGRVYSRHYFKARKIVRCDLSPGKGDITCNSERLPFADASFDLVFANWMIYKTDILNTFREIVRVLKPGGYLMGSWGLPNQLEVKDITTVARSLFHFEETFELEYQVRGEVRYGEAMFGRVREQTDDCFRLRLKPPVLVVVAHWDDEVISLGGFLERYATADFTLACATYRINQPTYEQIFLDYCSTLGIAKAVTLDISHREHLGGEGRDARMGKLWPMNPPELRVKMEERLGDLSRFRTVISHHPNGDYGRHPQHVTLSRAIREIFPEDVAVWAFGGLAGTWRMKMSRAMRKEKLRLIKVYQPGYSQSRFLPVEYLTRVWKR